MLMKFQGQWMSVDISSSFFPKVVGTGEVKTCSRSSCHGTDRKAPACSAPPSCTAPVSHHSSLHSQEPPHTALLRCFVREMSQQPSRSRKSAGRWGHQTQQPLRLHWPSKVCGELVGSAQHPFSFLYWRTGHARTPSSGEGGCTGSQDTVIQSNAKAQESTHRLPGPAAITFV